MQQYIYYVYPGIRTKRICPIALFYATRKILAPSLGFDLVLSSEHFVDLE